MTRRQAGSRFLRYTLGMASFPFRAFRAHRHVLLRAMLAVVCLLTLDSCTSTQDQSNTIRVETLVRRPASQVDIKPLMEGEILGVEVHHIAVGGPLAHEEVSAADVAVVWLVVDGRGTLSTRDQEVFVDGESIARAPQGWDWQIRAEPGSTLHLLRIRQQLTPDDLAEIPKHPELQQASYVKRFQDCEPYSEAIKSPKTISRTLLPEHYVPRMAMGTVETTGPDAVGEHKHPMLEQFFFGLRGNNITVTADGQAANLAEFALLHIPLGSMHGARVDDGNRMHYIWMDFFFNKEGQEWLQTHKPIQP